MIAAIKKQIRVQYENWVVCLIITMGGWIAGGILFGVVNALLKEEAKEFIPIGTVMAAALALLFLGIVGMTTMELYFNIEVSMGFTRKHFFVSYYMVCLLANLFGAALVWLMGLAERWIGLRLYPDLEQAVDLPPYLLKWGAPAAILLAALSVLMGSLAMRFGKKVYWALWVVWMTVCIAGPRIAEAVEEAPDSVFGGIGRALIRLAQAIPGDLWITGGILLVIVGTAVSCRLLGRQQVTA